MVHCLFMTDDGLILGVRDKNVEYMMKMASVIAFVQEGDLWSYSPGNGKFVDVFHFRRKSRTEIFVIPELNMISSCWTLMTVGIWISWFMVI